MVDSHKKLIERLESLNVNNILDFYDVTCNEFGVPLVLNNLYSHEMYQTDNAISIPIFRWRNFQIELYLITDVDTVYEHSHPGVKVLQQVYFYGTGWRSPSPVLLYPETHAGKGTMPEKTIMLTYEQWTPKVNMTTLAATWKGKTGGPIQDALIKKIYPDAIVENGYADVSNIIYS
jgi:hypothetical protein